MAHFKKGMEVHVRDHRGQANTRERYTIRSCGKKQAVLDYVRPESESSGYYRSRGYTYYIEDLEHMRARYGNDGIPSHIRTSWSEHFVLAGADGWDAKEN